MVLTHAHSPVQYVRAQVAAFFENVDVNDPLALLTPAEVRSVGGAGVHHCVSVRVVSVLVLQEHMLRGRPCASMRGHGRA